MHLLCTHNAVCSARAWRGASAPLQLSLVQSHGLTHRCMQGIILASGLTAVLVAAAAATGAGGFTAGDLVGPCLLQHC